MAAGKVQDAGRTQVASGTMTVVGVFGTLSQVDAVCAHFKLL